MDVALRVPRTRGACVEKLDKAKGGCCMHVFSYVVTPLIMGAMMPQFFRPSIKKIVIQFLYQLCS